MTCPYCSSIQPSVKNGKNVSGSQRLRCQTCRRTYTLETKPKGYSPERRQLALRLYLEGMSFRAIARIVAVHPQTIINWVEAHAQQLPSVNPPPDPLEVVELDELYTFIGEKKDGFTS